MIYLATIRPSELNEIKSRFRGGGIPIYIASDYGLGANDIPGIGASQRHASGQAERYNIFVCLDEQLEEGRRLLDDENYNVIAPVDVAKFEETMDKLGENGEVERHLLDKLLLQIFGVVLLSVLLLILYAALTTP